MNRRVPILTVLAAVLLTAAFWFLLYSPKNEEKAELVAETEALQARQTELRNEIVFLEDVQANELKIRAELARIEEIIPSGTLAQPAAVRHFQLAADAAGVTITTINFAVPKGVENAPAAEDASVGLASITVDMNVEGGYFQVVDFFRRLEVEVPRGVLLESFNMREGQNKLPHLETLWTGDLFAIVPIVQAQAAAPADDDAVLTP